MRRKMLWLGLVLALTVLLLPAGAQAANKKALKKLGKSRTYTIDLNGGAAEKVKYTIQKVNPDKYGNTTDRFNLYINGKLVYKRTLAAYSSVTSVYLADIKTSDRYKELVVNYSGDASDWYFFILRYTAAGKVKAYIKQGGILQSGRCSLEGNKKVFDGKGVFYTTMDTPFYNRTFGCFWAKMPAYLANDKITFKKASYYELTNVADYTPGVFGESYYILAHNMTLYTTSSRKTVKAELPAGTRFIPKYVSQVSTEKVTEYGWTSTYSNLAVKVKTKDGTTGWLYFPGHSSIQYLTRVPAWG